jgi:hypothetical protein
LWLMAEKFLRQKTNAVSSNVILKRRGTSTLISVDHSNLAVCAAPAPLFVGVGFVVP